jgi:hypothetical protein
MKELLLNLLHYWEYQLTNDKCTVEEIQSVANLALNNLDVDATAKDMADYFGQSESNVRNVVTRNFCGNKNKPKRKVYYNFAWVLKVMPKSWRK